MPIHTSVYRVELHNISSPRYFITTAAAAAAIDSMAYCSTDDVAGKPSHRGRSSSDADSRHRHYTVHLSSTSSCASRGKTAESGTDRSAAPKRRWNTAGQVPRVDRWPKKGRTTYAIGAGIKACTGVQQLQQLVQQNGSAMDHINLAAAIVKLQKVFGRLVIQQQQQVDQQAATLLKQLWQLQQPKLPQ
eukprot:GHUV01051419.1.p1 GENE.GHUV01051419.1~~GHUV01051419.1.p1  ORF type:complete len:189 (+),score=84.21 GHUV01051419.1:3-569(+)